MHCPSLRGTSEAEGVIVIVNVIVIVKKVHACTARGACMYFFYYMVVMEWIDINSLRPSGSSLYKQRDSLLKCFAQYVEQT